MSYRGLPTTSRTWVEGSTWIETHTQYDKFGNAIKARDPIGNEATTEFSADHKYAHPTKVISPAPDTTNTHGTNQASTAETTYDFTTGLPLTVKDDFGQITRTVYDGMLRPIRVYADNFIAPESQTNFGVPNASGQLGADQRFVRVIKQIDANNWDEAITWFDGLGRTIKTQAKDSQGDVFVETHYDAFGRVDRVTNPYRVGDTVYWSKTKYDAAGRAVKSYAPATDAEIAIAATNDDANLVSLGVTSFDISTVPDFIGTVVATEDASKRKGRSITNALGQLLRVDEPQGISSDANADLGPLDSPLQKTTYKYDQYGKMVEVTQGVQKRWFKYDSLGRLLRVRQPEQEINQSLDMTDPFNTEGDWTAGFAYDVLGNVIRATDANGVNIINEYDMAGRVTKRCYTKPNVTLAPSVVLCSQIPASSPDQRSTDTSIVENFYDGKGLDALQTPHNFAKGKLTKVKNDFSQTRYTEFDNFGRLEKMEQTTPVGDETFNNAPVRESKYTYNFSGALIEEEYPSGRKVKNDFESDGDLLRIYGTANSTAIERTYATSFSYTPDGRIARLKLGNGLWENAKFNTRLQVTELAVGHGVTSGDLWKLGYEYGELNSDGITVDATKNTGNIAKQTLSFNGLAQPFVQAYKYDPLYRLTEAKETQNGTQTWKQVFEYDRYGNRLTHNKFIGAEQVTQTTITHPAIDPNKNRINSPGYVFDKNGNLTTDGENRHFVFNADNKQKEVRDASNNLVGEYFYDGEGKRVKKKTYVGGVFDEETVFVYSSGKLIAEYSNKPPSSTPTTSFTITDQLGSPRVLVNSLGEVVSRRDFMPFGEEVAPDGAHRTTNQKYNNDDNIRQKFTGYQKDEEAQLDFAEARMYENRHGRFTAVDPLLASGKSANPQTFNRYVYGMNSPLFFTDPSGLQVATASGRVYTNGSRYRIFNSGTIEDGYRPFDGSHSFSLDGYDYDVTPNGWTNLGSSRERSIAASLTSSFASQAAGAMFDTGAGVGKWGWNSMAATSNAFYWGLERAALFASPDFTIHRTPYWEPTNQAQVNAGIAMTGLTIYAGGFAAPRTPSFASSGFTSTTRTSNPFILTEAPLAEIYSRPSTARVGTVSSAWENAATGANGGRLCPTCGKEIFWKTGENRLNLWDLDHQPAWSLRSLEGKTRQQVLDDFNTGTRMECYFCNRSRGNVPAQ